MGWSKALRLMELLVLGFDCTEAKGLDFVVVLFRLDTRLFYYKLGNLIYPELIGENRLPVECIAYSF